MHDDREVLQVAGERNGEYFAEFVDGSSQGVDAALYRKALQEWSWKEVTVDNKVWAHPPEKPEKSGGWTRFFTSPAVRRRAMTGAGVCTGFLIGLAGECDGPNDNSDFSTAFRISQLAGVVLYAGFQISKIFLK